MGGRIDETAHSDADNEAAFANLTKANSSITKPQPGKNRIGERTKDIRSGCQGKLKNRAKYEFYRSFLAKRVLLIIRIRNRNFDIPIFAIVPFFLSFLFFFSFGPKEI